MSERVHSRAAEHISYQTKQEVRKFWLTASQMSYKTKISTFKNQPFHIVKS